jgi:serine protease inhibitor
LSELIKNLGAKAAFDRNSSDFSGMHTPSNKENKLFISNIIHQTFIEVNENGTEAAATTVVQMQIGSSFTVRDPIEFKCDRPFMFIIHESIGNGILFIGKLMNPNI